MNSDHQSISDRHYRNLNAYKDDPAYKTLEGYEERVAFFATFVGQKWEIDETVYEEAFEIVPPLGVRGDSFYLGEFLFDDITHKFSREGGRVFCEVAHFPPRPAPRTPAAVRAAPER